MLRGAQPRAGSVVREVNLAFNSLSSLLGMAEACPGLERLSAAHNQLRTLPDMSRLLCLCRLDLSHNRLSDVAPLANRLVLFWSDARVPHEVLPSHADRYAVSIWYCSRVPTGGE